MNRIAGFYTHRGFTPRVKSAIRRQLLRDTVIYTGVAQQAEPEFDPWPEFIEVLAPSRGLLWGVCWGLVIYAVVAGVVWAVWRGR